MKHSLKMILGCLLPFLLLFLLPLFGITEGTTFFLFAILMFACHLTMMGRHDHPHEQKGEQNDEDA